MLWWSTALWRFNSYLEWGRREKENTNIQYLVYRELAVRAKDWIKFCPGKE